MYGLTENVCVVPSLRDGSRLFALLMFICVILHTLSLSANGMMFLKIILAVCMLVGINLQSYRML